MDSVQCFFYTLCEYRFCVMETYSLSIFKRSSLGRCMASLSSGFRSYRARRKRAAIKKRREKQKRDQKRRSRRADKNFCIAEAQRVSPNLTVQNGVFKGLKYPRAAAIHSTFFPKILGSYECELEPALREIARGASVYDTIVDVGCAEGYYAIGLLRLMPQARCHAFDSRPTARIACRQMAEHNEIAANRLHISSFCDAAMLEDILIASPRALVISDCEGYEKRLFSDISTAVIAPHDILIETHDCFDIEISTLLKKRLASSHELTSFHSVDDVQKALSYRFPELSDYSLAERRVLLAEERATQMEWLWAQARLPTVSRSAGV